MINNLLRNFCLITFALIAPITLPAGGIQKNLNQNKFPDNSKEIILNANCSLYTFPQTSAKKLMVLNSGSSLLVLHKWVANQKDIWARVELASNKFIEHPNSIKRGWIKM